MGLVNQAAILRFLTYSGLGEYRYFTQPGTTDTGWLNRMSHRKQNGGRISMLQVGQRIAPSILCDVPSSHPVPPLLIN